MRRKWIYAVQIALSLAIVCSLATGCGLLSSTPTPPEPKGGEDDKDKSTKSSAQYLIKHEPPEFDEDGRPVYKDTYMELRTITFLLKGNAGEPIVIPSFIGQECAYWFMDFDVDRFPFVVNFSYTLRPITALEPSDTRVNFECKILRKRDLDLVFHGKPRRDISVVFGNSQVGEFRGTDRHGVSCYIVYDKDQYVAVMKASGADDVLDWWIKIGVEP